jgi:hypothetical protein
MDSAIAGTDLSTLLGWGSNGDNGAPNAASDYDSDNNGDDRDDGRDYDFASGAPGELGFSQDGSVGARTGRSGATCRERASRSGAGA